MPLTDRQAEALRLKREGVSQREAARAMDISREGYRSILAAAEKNERLGDGVHEALERAGFGDLRGQHSGWVHHEAPDGTWASVYYYLGKDGGEVDLREMVAHAVEEMEIRAAPARPEPSGENLLVISIADLHIGRLCARMETGHTYTVETAVHRATAGTEALLARARAFGIGHILVVIGNDKVHFDTPRRTTTSGTPQDTDGSLFDMFRAARFVDCAIIDACRAVAPVTVLHCPSNHDWVLGWALAQIAQAYYRDCPEVTISDYGVSERHRKYFGWNDDLIVVTHGDGAREADLPSIIMHEARSFLGERVYVYAAHLHHKVRKLLRAGAEKIEKDTPGLTIIGGRSSADMGEGVEIEVVRSPAPPDSWHDRNGYLNRQAVEAFMHSPGGGQFLRITEWF